jgi:hypothetical protein
MQNATFAEGSIIKQIILTGKFSELRISNLRSWNCGLLLIGPCSSRGAA